jgi:hypothetical protein
MSDDLTTRLVAAFEKAAKAVRGGLLTAADVVTHGIVAAADNLAFLLDGLCATPDPAPADFHTAGSVVAPSPKQGSDSGSEEIAPFAVRPSEPHLPENPHFYAAALRRLADMLDPPKEKP